ncbi:DUF1501 domain-containing protein [Amphritea sp. 2_MG-2023]|uniref:DUF1501 domain-containing protein n=1 Tax=Amphritea TaxID=515417 RepID=UPI001C064F43|nr:MULTISPECIES: DUF1501 domain-containing protein [Amphritea]MBU2964349.1 DUF1501 domain-containing protein [Amphritea atlantica]MDO6419691.1 DUF1501 domain-containing protein [Amphritea sp. 2_MG-2023]
MKRRSLLKLAALSPLASSLNLVANVNNAVPILVLVELNGGNDSLNSFIPTRQLDRYKELRPKLRVSPDKLIALDDEFSLHPSLKALYTSWESKDLALIHGLGYEHPNRSHFRSIDIWDTGSTSNETLKRGWLSDVVSGMGANKLDCIVFGRNARCVSGGKSRFLQLKSISKFLNDAENISASLYHSDNNALMSIINAQNFVSNGNELLRNDFSAENDLKDIFPKTPFGKNLADICKLIQLNVGVPVFKVALTGFDTHSNQGLKHSQLLKQLATGLNSLKVQLQSSGHWPNVLVMTYSEFGRRIAENGSGGTDHGTAATHIVMGGRVKGGHYGKVPDLLDLDNDDWKYTTDFRRLYQTIITDWWQRDYQIADGIQGLGFVYPGNIN